MSAHNPYQSVSEPYWQLVQQGVVFADGPTVDDLEQQVRLSCSLMTGVAGDDLVFDRCPLDLIAYLDVVSAAEGFEWIPDSKLVSQIKRAPAQVDTSCASATSRA